jgi:hypothetical protein
MVKSSWVGLTWQGSDVTTERREERGGEEVNNEGSENRGKTGDADARRRGRREKLMMSSGLRGS